MEAYFTVTFCSSNRSEKLFTVYDELRKALISTVVKQDCSRSQAVRYMLNK